MTMNPPVQAGAAAVVEPVNPVQTRCTVCSHNIEDHDAISVRFCQATQAQAVSRNCICR
jgi:hypothetical protein